MGEDRQNRKSTPRAPTLQDVASANRVAPPCSRSPSFCGASIGRRWENSGRRNRDGFGSFGGARPPGRCDNFTGPLGTGGSDLSTCGSTGFLRECVRRCADWDWVGGLDLFDLRTDRTGFSRCGGFRAGLLRLSGPLPRPRSRLTGGRPGNPRQDGRLNRLRRRLGGYDVLIGRRIGML